MVIIQMSHEQFEKEKTYRVALSVAKVMLKNELITDEEYGVIDTMLAEKYEPIFGNL